MCLAIPTRILSIDENRVALVELGGVERRVGLIMTPEAQVGDYVLVHAGYAINVMDAEEAELTLQTFRDLAEIETEMDRQQEDPQ